MVALVLTMGLWPGCICVSCFVGDSQVSTPEGPVPIRSIRPGDVVLSMEPREGRLVERRVVSVHETYAPRVFRVRAGDVTLQGVTPEHPVYDALRGTFVPAGELEGAALRTASADLRVAAMASDWGVHRVYNLDVEGPENTFFVDGVLVHNKESLPPCDPCDAQDRMANAALAQCIVNADLGSELGYRLGNCGCATSDQLTAVTELTCPGLSSLDGIERLSRLRTLMLGESTLTSLAPLTGLPLEHLEVDSSSVADLEPLRNVTSLTVLSVRRSRVRNIQMLRHHDALTALDLRDNPLEEIVQFAREFSCANATTISLGGTQLTASSNVDLLELQQRGCVTVPASF